MSEELVITPYSPLWPAVFDMEQRRLLALFNEAVMIEHIGSTAVPGLGGKPVIDIMVGSPSLTLVDARIPALEAEGWKYRRELEHGNAQWRYLTRFDQPPGKFSLYAVVYGGPIWKRYLAFRDALRADPALAHRYWRVKERIGNRPRPSAAEYKVAKDDFISGALDRKG